MSSFTRPAVKRRVQAVLAPPPNAPVNRGAPPSWVTNRKYTVTTANNRWKTYVHDNRRTGMRTQVRVAPGETLANTWRMNGFPAPVPAPGLEEGEIYTRASRILSVRAPSRAPMRLPPLRAPTPLTNQNKNNKAYIKGLVTRIIHKVTNQNSEDRKYIARLVGGIISKIKRQNGSVPRLAPKNNGTSRKRTNAGGFMGGIMRNKASKKAYANREGMTLAQVNALLRSGLVNENNLNNALKSVRAAQQRTRKPVNILVQQGPALRTYEDPVRAPGLILNSGILHTGGAGTGDIVKRANVKPPNRAGRLNASMTSFLGMRPENVPSKAPAPKNKKLTGAKASLAKKLKLKF